MQDEATTADTMIDPGNKKGSAMLLEALAESKKAFEAYERLSENIDRIYSVGNSTVDTAWVDNEYDIFWASLEILKPAIFSRVPKPVITPRFNDRSNLMDTASQLIERAVTVPFDSEMGEVLRETRDDLAMSNRGVVWVRYESEDGEQSVCFEALESRLFLHELARKWADVGWVARGAYLTRMQMRKRFGAESGYENATYSSRRDEFIEGADDGAEKCLVWEVWHKTDNKVYWVTEGVPDILDSDKPHLTLKRFFPCPRPAYGTLRRRTLVPVPDYVRYERHIEQINSTTARIHTLLDRVRLKGFFPQGGEIGQVVEQLLSQDDDATLLIPVPSAAFAGLGGKDMIQFMPLKDISDAILGLIQARGQLIQDFYQLSGISDIMRGATESDETLGAQRLKQQNGSIRVKSLIDELARVAKDAAEIAAEIMCQKFTAETLMDMAQMEIPTKREIEKDIKKIEEEAANQLEKINKEFEAAINQAGPDVDRAQVEAAFKEKQRQILQPFSERLKDASNRVPIEDVMELLRDSRARCFAIDVETDTTILTDEVVEKAARAEFLGAFTSAAGAATQLAAAGEAGAKLAGGILKFALAPYRVGRNLSQMIDDFIDAAPEMAAAMAQDGGDQEAQKELIAAQNKLADAEMQKAQAQTMKAQADSQAKMAELERKMGEAHAAAQDKIRTAQEKAARLQIDAQAENQRLKVELAETRKQMEKSDAEIAHLKAQTAEILSSIGISQRAQSLNEQKAADDAAFRERESQRAESEQL